MASVIEITLRIEVDRDSLGPYGAEANAKFVHGAMRKAFNVPGSIVEMRVLEDFEYRLVPREEW
jgi:hypothetical protein